MKALLIAEKSSLKEIIRNVYNKHRSEIPYDITFLEQSGHLLALKSPDEMDEELKIWSWDTLPIHPEQHGGWQYKIAPKSKKQNISPQKRYMKIKKELNEGNYDFIIHAGDPDAEGELLVRLVLSSLHNKLPVKRYWSTATTPKHVLHALQNLKDDDNDEMLVNLLKSAYARQHSDYRFGMNISRAATLKMNITVSCGRVRTAILSIVCKREQEIKNFKPSTCYGVKVQYEEGFTGQYMQRKVSETEEDDEESGYVYFDTLEEAEEFISTLKNEAVVQKYEKKNVKSSPPELFNLAAIQSMAGKMMGYTPKKTLSIIQSLYENGFLSYPRSDCKYIASDEDFEGILESAKSVPELRKHIDTIQAEDISRVKKSKRWVNDKKMAESGHTAIIPTSMQPNFDELTNEEKEIYRLVCRQYVSIFMPPLIQKKIVMETSIDGNIFRSTGKTVVQKGYTELFNMDLKENDLPEHTTGDKLMVSKYEVADKTTTCPKRFTESDLIDVCEMPHKYLDDKNLKKLGKRLKIGTSATRADIIHELIHKLGYLEIKKEKKVKHVYPSDTGYAIWSNIKDCNITKVDMTGQWEIYLEKVRNGELSLEQIEKKMIADVNQMIEDIKNTDMKVLSDSNGKKVIGTCPKCKAADVISSKKSFYCSDYKSGCKFGAFKKIWDSSLSDDEFLELASGEIIKKEIKKDGKKWVSELKYNFDDCKIEFVIEKKEPSKYTCPSCGKILMENSKIISCEKECGFRLWKNIGSVTLLNEQIRLFFEKGDTGLVKNLTSKSGKKYDCHFVLSEDKKGADFKFPERTQEETTYKCPNCNEMILKNGMVFECKDNCGFKLWSRCCGVDLTEQQIEMFFKKGSTGVIKGLQGKSKKFDAAIVLSNNNLGTEFAFPKKRRK